jgi:hypothetical protein
VDDGIEIELTERGAAVDLRCRPFDPIWILTEHKCLECREQVEHLSECRTEPLGTNIRAKRLFVCLRMGAEFGARWPTSVFSTPKLTSCVIDRILDAEVLTFRQSFDGSARDVCARYIAVLTMTLQTHASSVRCRDGPPPTG